MLSSSNFRTLFEDMSDPVVLLEGDTPLRLNEAAHRHFGKKCMMELLKKDIDDFRLSGERKASFRRELEVDEGISIYNIRIKPVSPDKKTLLIEFSDISEEEKLKSRLSFLQSMMDSIPNPIFYKTPDGKYIGCNKMFEKYVGISKEELAGKTVRDITSHDWKFQCARTDMQILGTGKLKPYETVITMPDGGSRNVIFSKALLKNSDGKPEAIVGTIQDITERKKAEDKIQKLAYYDTLTGLPNRQLLLDRIKIMVEHSKRNEETFAVLFIDVDRFKTINDTLGHTAGDQLLMNIANILKANVRSCDTVARLGGDEFVIVLTNVDEKTVSHIAGKLMNMLSRPQFVNGHELFSSLSIGISMFPSDAEDGETLLKNADMAMYQAKEQGRNNFQFFSLDMNNKVMHRLVMENDLRHAMDRDEFYLEYQPQYNVDTGKMFGVEALLRWHKPEKGIMPPASFISLAEDTGLILPIGEWVLLRACFQNKEWEMNTGQKIITSVNISAVQFKQKNFLNSIKNILKVTGADPACIELELTESVLMTDVDQTLQTLKELKDLGLKLSIDDFGTGYSSLNYLRFFPIDRLKIDRSFVTNIMNDKDNAAITQAIIAMAETLKLKVTAEGVEQEDELNTLRSFKCHDIQGFLLARPSSPEIINKLMSDSL
ncbi:EAL domain-containing protein [Seleniivibrio sp.]|uniref:EAL domain-containing protein n=1 Tax=Seleniivibrio sp. TaxID=2898801 RepID=UPI0025F973E3|nr:EAL domain-containing protein [Seleniivibrio sp.]